MPAQPHLRRWHRLAAAKQSCQLQLITLWMPQLIPQPVLLLQSKLPTRQSAAATAASRAPCGSSMPYLRLRLRSSHPHLVSVTFRLCALISRRVPQQQLTHKRTYKHLPASCGMLAASLCPGSSSVLRLQSLTPTLRAAKHAWQQH